VSEGQDSRNACLETLTAKFGHWLEELAGQWFHGTSRFDAADLVQDTLLAACRCVDQIRDARPERQAAWLRTILARRITDIRRRQTRAKRNRNRECRLDSISSEELTIDGKVCPDDQVTQEEEWTRIAFAFEKLTSLQRVALHLRFVEGFTFAEIAARLGRNRASAERLVSRGIAKMQRELNFQNAN